MVEAHVTYELGFFYSGHLVEQLLLEYPVARIGVDGEVAHTKRGEVLEEVRALRGVNTVVLQSYLNNHPCC